MRSAIGLLLLAAGVAAAQQSSAVRKLNATILTLKDAAPREEVSRQLALDFSAVADPDHRPMGLSLNLLASQLTIALPAKTLRPELLNPLTTKIVDILYSAGTSTIGFFESVDTVEAALLELGVTKRQAHEIAQRMLTIGKQVRGPDDMPVDAPGPAGGAIRRK